MRFPWPLDRKRRTSYKSAIEVKSRLAPGVRYTISRMSFARRVALMARIRELANRAEFLAAGRDPGEHMFGFAKLLLIIAFGYAMIAYYESPIPGIGTSFSNSLVISLSLRAMIKSMTGPP